MSRPLSVCLLIGSLEFGGAERQVVELVRSFKRERVEAFICSLSANVPLADALPDRTRSLEIVLKRSRFDFTVIFHLAMLLRRRRVDVLHSFLFDAEIIGRLAGALARVPLVVASERNSNYARPLRHRIALRLTRSLSQVMVANSEAGRRFNLRTLGLREDRLVVVRNGVDTEKFQPDAAAGARFRAEHGIPKDAPVIGMVASYKRQKAHDLFLRMAQLVRKERSDARFLLVGGLVADDDESQIYAREMRALAAALGLEANCHFLPNQQDVKPVYNACDLLALLSTREGTPNVLLEALACGVPVLASAVADNAVLIRDAVTGYIVAPGDYAAAAARAVSLFNSKTDRASFGAAGRSHVLEHFSMPRAAERMESVYRRFSSLPSSPWTGAEGIPISETESLAS